MNKDNTKLCAIVMASISFVLILLPIKIVFLNNVCGFFSGDKVTDYIMVYFAAITLVYTCYEYKSHRDRVKAEVLGMYNERYSKDEHINKVVPFLISEIMNTKTENASKELKMEDPSVHNMEMFMRFFEEMELQIEKDRLDADSVYKLFSFYALFLDSKLDILERHSIDDYNRDNWELFFNFINRMAKIDFKDSVWYSENDEIRFDNEYHVIMNNIPSNYSYQSGMIIFMQDSKEIKIKHNMGGISNEKKYVEELEYEGKIYKKEIQ